MIYGIDGSKKIYKTREGAFKAAINLSKKRNDFVTVFYGYYDKRVTVVMVGVDGWYRDPKTNTAKPMGYRCHIPGIADLRLNGNGQIIR